MMADDDLPKKQPEVQYRKLDTMSVKALEDYIGELESEIGRTKEEIKKRGGARAAADAFFS